MDECFIFKPCSSDNSFKIIPKSKIDPKKIIEILIKKMNGKVIADTSFIKIIEIEKSRITVNKKGDIIIREASEKKAREIATQLFA